MNPENGERHGTTPIELKLSTPIENRTFVTIFERSCRVFSEKGLLQVSLAVNKMDEELLSDLSPSFDESDKMPYISNGIYLVDYFAGAIYDQQLQAIKSGNSSDSVKAITKGVEVLSKNKDVFELFLNYLGNRNVDNASLLRSSIEGSDEFIIQSMRQPVVTKFVIDRLKSLFTLGSGIRFSEEESGLSHIPDQFEAEIAPEIPEFTQLLYQLNEKSKLGVFAWSEAVQDKRNQRAYDEGDKYLKILFKTLSLDPNNKYLNFKTSQLFKELQKNTPVVLSGKRFRLKGPNAIRFFYEFTETLSGLAMKSTDASLQEVALFYFS